MLFNSMTFLYFITVLLVVNSLLPLRFRNGWILICSFVFYMSWSPIYILLLMVTALIDYFVAIKMAGYETKEERKPWLVASLVFSLGSLLYFKYTQMFIDTGSSMASWFGVKVDAPLLHIALPLGISFYTFETMSYGIDVYRGELKPKRSFFEYLNFLMFFPKLIAGPIVRASELLHQIPEPRVCKPGHFKEAINLIFLGFFKKIVCADNIAPFVERVFADPQGANRFMVLSAIYGYSIQLYFDFSAYSDIARGCAKLLGYELPLNFNHPYYATSVTDFWRRWHMTLSRWLRDYLYVSLGGNRRGKFKTYRNLFLTMLLGGLWHGANWTFVIWGAINGGLLAVERLYHDVRGSKPKSVAEMGWVERGARSALVFHLMAFAFVFFRAPTLNGALAMFKSLLMPTNFSAHYDFALFLIPAFTASYLAFAWLRKHALQFEPQKGVRVLLYGALLAAMMVFGASQAEFIYFQF